MLKLIHQRFTMQTSRALATLGLVVMATFLGVGCGDEGTLGPEVVATPGPQGVGLGLGGHSNSTHTASKTFTPGTAGTMVIDDGMTLVVGAGAIDASVTIECEATVQRNSLTGKVVDIVWTFQPAMTFSESIHLNVDEDLIAGLAQRDGGYHLNYLDDGTWVFSDEGEVVGDDVQFDIDHFSKYAVGND